jgi:aromatic-L-amino-acid decarboxylase
MDCSALWTSRPEVFREAFTLVPEYLRTDDEAESLSDYGPALGRRFRALKLWAVIRCFGREGLQHHVREGIRLAELFERWVRDEPGWEVVAPRRVGRRTIARPTATRCWHWTARTVRCGGVSVRGV